MELIVQRPNKQIFRREGPEGPQRVKLFGESVPASDVLHEALNHARACEAGLPVPCLREVTKLEDRWAVVADFVEGPTLLERMEAGPGGPRWMELFVRLQMRVHAARAPQMQRQKDKLNRRVSAGAAYGLDATTRYELHVRLEAMPDHQKVCHGDVVPANILLRGEEAPIIDWSHATQGNASADAANTYLTLLMQQRGDLAAAYLKLFCERSDTALQYIQRWIPIVAGARLCTCKTEEERVFCRGWCEGVV
ncbi:MAG: aminoglycoside phosphotransferase family protein [Oscillospiraceae bacterium]|jgi:thiamine kinase-like enzyme|nr:aminoglycoside phosphotransferase family protein [Oscillospiraceae bacterium]